MEFDFSLNIFEKYSNTKFDENPFNGSWVTPCGHRDRQKNMTKLITTFRIFVDAPKKEAFHIDNPYSHWCLLLFNTNQSVSIHNQYRGNVLYHVFILSLFRSLAQSNMRLT
jgi:hypothetical protein